MRLATVIFAFSLGPVATTAFAQEACDRNDDSQRMLNLCADQDYEAADKRLNATYSGIVDDLRGDGKTLGLLRKTQRAWIAFRDGECAYAAADSEDGSIYPLLVSMCLTKMTNERIRQLEADGNCAGGDAGCVASDEDDVGEDDSIKP